MNFKHAYDDEFEQNTLLAYMNYSYKLSNLADLVFNYNNDN